MYENALPATAFALRFHLLGRFIKSETQYRAHLADAAARWDLPINYGAFGGFYAHADARKDVGHYLEWFAFPNAEFFADVPRY